MKTGTYAGLLWGLFTVFALRIVAQLAQLIFSVPWLPAFDAWHSAVLPYSVLLVAQFLIALGMAKVAIAFSRGSIEPSMSAARIWLPLGVLYLALMTLRLSLGLTVLAGHFWFASHLSTIFHFVLASFVLLVGLSHAEKARGRAPWPA